MRREEGKQGAVKASQTGGQRSARQEEKKQGYLLGWRLLAEFLFLGFCLFCACYGLKEDDPVNVSDYQPTEGLTYQGVVKNGFFEGSGRLEMAGGFSYQGSFKGGHFDGRGKVEGPGWTMEGSFKEGAAVYPLQLKTQAGLILEMTQDGGWKEAGK